MAGSGTAHLRTAEDALLRVEHLVVDYRLSDGQRVRAVSDVSFDIAEGETLGLVGESGSGKSTAARAVMMLPAPTSGTVRFGGIDLGSLNAPELRRNRRRIQMIFQDPISSLNPRRRVRDLVAEGPTIWGDRTWTDDHVAELLDAVGIDVAKMGDRRPSELSGGQCQRVAIARAIALQPQLLIADEAVSALDVSVQAQILNLLEDLKERFGLTMLFIAHNLAAVKNISDQIAVMYLGKLCEVGPSFDLLQGPAHPYTQGLVASIPVADPAVRPTPVEIVGDVPSPLNPPSGCRFRTRCPRADNTCVDVEPVMAEIAPGRFVACHHPFDVQRHGHAA
jgi:peptide/nickel transport system ATP-binding protein